MKKKNTTETTRKTTIGGVIKKFIIPAIIIIALFFILTEDEYTEMSKAKNAFLTFVVFIGVCAGIYCGVMTFFSVISGWRVLHLRFPAPETARSAAPFFSQSVEMGYMDYRMSVTVRFTDTGMVFSPSRFFSFMHRPFIIPYEKIDNFTKTGPSGQDSEFTVEGITIRMSGESAEALNRKMLDPSLPAVSLAPGRDDPEHSMKRGEQRLTTRKCRFEELQPAFVSQVRDFVKSKKAGALKGAAVHCYETTFMEKGLFWGFFGIVYHRNTDLVITPEWFFWGVIDGEGSSAGGARLKDIARTIDPGTILTADPLEFKGINISGLHYDESRVESWRINIGNDEEGNSFRKKLADAVGKTASSQ